MDIFDFPYHSIGDEYPESSTNVKFGRGYSFASAPRGPDQMIFHLDFEAMFFWFHDETIQTGVKPQINARDLQLFYEKVRMYTPFSYQHPIRGLVTCRFLKPLPRFKSMKEKTIYDADSECFGHQVEPFTLDMIQLP